MVQRQATSIIDDGLTFCPIMLCGLDGKLIHITHQQYANVVEKGL